MMRRLEQLPKLLERLEAQTMGLHTRLRRLSNKRNRPPVPRERDHSPKIRRLARLRDRTKAPETNKSRAERRMQPKKPHLRTSYLCHEDLRQCRVSKLQIRWQMRLRPIGTYDVEDRSRQRHLLVKLLAVVQMMERPKKPEGQLRQRLGLKRLPQSGGQSPSQQLE